MSDPITITAPEGVTGRFQTALSLGADEVASLAAGLPLELPEEKTFSDLVLFSLAVHPQGGGRLVVALK